METSTLTKPVTFLDGYAYRPKSKPNNTQSKEDKK